MGWLVRSCVVATALALLVAGCGKEGSGVADSEAGSPTSESTTTSESTSTTVEPATTTTTTTSTTSESTTTSSTTTTTQPTTTEELVPAGLPTPEDVALQYDALCLQTNSRDLVEKWFEPGVLDDLRCKQGGGGDFQGFVTFMGCEAIPDAAGEASHACFFYYEGGGYSILIGDLGRGYRGLAATFVVD